MKMLQGEGKKVRNLPFVAFDSFFLVFCMHMRKKVG